MKAGTEADSMQERPTTFGELLRRFMPVQGDGNTGKHGDLSVAASAVPLTSGERTGRELSGQNSLPSRPLSVILHSVTARGMRLTHAQPLRARQVAVHIGLVTGEAVQVLLSLGRSRKTGELYETQAEFIQSEAETCSFVFGAGETRESGRHRVASVGNGG